MIKNKLKLGLFVLVVFSVFGVINYVSAADLVWSADTNITIGVNDYVIVSGSAATTLNVGSSSITVTVPASSTFTLRSDAGYIFSTSPSTGTETCSGSQTLTITGAATSVEITPTTTVCRINSAGGGGGSSYVPPVVTSVVTLAVPAVPATPAVSASVVKFTTTKAITTKSTKPIVLNLQSGLNTALGLNLKLDGSFGPKTRDGVKQFQKTIKGLKVDGIPGKNTLKALNNALGL